MTYASTSIDRRADYYVRAAAVIAADPLDFYTRAERGRRFQAGAIKHASNSATTASAFTSSAQLESLTWGNESRSQVQALLARKGIAA